MTTATTTMTMTLWWPLTTTSEDYRVT